MNQEKVSELRNWMQKNNVDLAYISDASHIGSSQALTAIRWNVY